jgi:probable addiction module antidote protein
MTIETAPWDAAEFLTTPGKVAAYIEAAMEENDPTFFAYALGVVARSKGMAQVAAEAGVTREALYKALSRDGDPKLSTVFGVLKALGLRMEIKAA